MRLLFDIFHESLAVSYISGVLESPVIPVFRQKCALIQENANFLVRKKIRMWSEAVK